MNEWTISFPSPHFFQRQKGGTQKDDSISVDDPLALANRHTIQLIPIEYSKKKNTDIKSSEQGKKEPIFPLTRAMSRNSTNDRNLLQQNPSTLTTRLTRLRQVLCTLFSNILLRKGTIEINRRSIGDMITSDVRAEQNEKNPQS